MTSVILFPNSRVTTSVCPRAGQVCCLNHRDTVAGQIPSIVNTQPVAGPTHLSRITRASHVAITVGREIPPVGQVVTTEALRGILHAGNSVAGRNAGAYTTFDSKIRTVGVLI